MIEKDTNLSKFISLLLRHHPGKLKLHMDNHGWVSVAELIEKLNKFRYFGFVTVERIENIVETDNKRRYDLQFFNNDLQIRANQGHSLMWVDLGLQEVKPFDILYHGTGYKYVKSINKKGIVKKTRQYVHLSASNEYAEKVGMRHGTPFVYKINAKQMYEDGCIFYLSKNGVWLTEYVDPKYFL